MDRRDTLLERVAPPGGISSKKTMPSQAPRIRDAAQSTLVGIELMHMLKKGQMVVEEGVKGLTPAEQFYALAA
jgi:hypothetical protein